MSEGLINPAEVPGAFKAFASTRLGAIYLGGVAAAVFAHATFKGARL